MTTELTVNQDGVISALHFDEDHIDVLDKGYVRLVDVMGTELKVVNAAKVSYQKQSKQFGPNESRLLNFLISHGHTSPFRHVMATFEVKAPLMVARQWWKYVVGSDHTMEAWNEASRRYVTSDEEFYIPTASEWRSKPESSKQGSGDPVPLDIGSLAWQMLMDDVDRQVAHYKWAMENGICAEQARLFLPAYGLYVSWYWTASLQSIIHFLNQRLEEDAQKEIQLYARAVHRLMQPKFPVTFSALLGASGGF